ncbi:MAG: metal-dependent transcriptional regulator [Candidatus Krumholzibacteriota bacterium]|nr:metal-dependent transcriptional regulator [Candidatus Krumholzibacteriota bacterium]
MGDMLTPSSEDYLQSIFLLDKSKNAVRVKDISSELGVSMPSVHHALNLLKEEKFIRHESYGHVELTRKGRKAGKKIYCRHEILLKFLTDILGVPGKEAQEETCRIEHYISEETQKKLADFIEMVESCPHSEQRHRKDAQE